MPTERSAVAQHQPFQDQRRSLDKDNAVGDAVKQAGDGHGPKVVSLCHRKGGQQVNREGRWQQHANVADGVPADGQQGAKQVAKVVPGGHRSTLPGSDLAIVHQIRQ